MEPAPTPTEGDTMRKLIQLILIFALGYAIYQLLTQQKKEWSGLTETEVRSKLDVKLSGRVPPEQAQVIGDKVVGQMRSRGLLSEEAAPNGAGTPETITT